MDKMWAVLCFERKPAPDGVSYYEHFQYCYGPFPTMLEADTWIMTTAKVKFPTRYRFKSEHIFRPTDI